MSNMHLFKFLLLAFRQYKRAMKGVRQLLVMRTSPAANGLTYIAERRRHKGHPDPKMDHLVCFLPGANPCSTLYHGH